MIRPIKLSIQPNNGTLSTSIDFPVYKSTAMNIPTKRVRTTTRQLSPRKMMLSALALIAVFLLGTMLFIANDNNGKVSGKTDTDEKKHSNGAKRSSRVWDDDSDGEEPILSKAKKEIENEEKEAEKEEKKETKKDKETEKEVDDSNPPDEEETPKEKKGFSHTASDPSFEIVAVTGLNAPFYGKCKNYIGSVMKWEPNLRIVVVDLGLSEDNKKELESMENVEVFPFDFSAYPSHVTNLGIFAFKPIAMKNVLDKYPAIFYLDPSVEYRQPIAEIAKQIKEKGYWYVHQEGKQTNLRCCGPVNELCHPGTVSYLKMKSSDFEGKSMCAGGMQGYVKGSDAYNKVLLKTIDCALVPECIAPAGASVANHRFDQCVFSLFINSQGFSCESNERFFAYPGTVPGFDDTNRNEAGGGGNVVLAMNRGRSQVYEAEIKYKGK